MFCDSNSFWSGIWVETLFENILFKPISPRRTDRHGVVLSGATCTSAIATAERERQEYPGRPNQKVSNRLHENKRQIFKGAEKTNVFMLLISRPCGNQNFENALVPIDLSHKPWDPLGARCTAWSRLPSWPQAGWEGSWAELKVWDGDVKISLVFNHKRENTIGFQTSMTSCGCHGMAVDCMVMSTLILYNRVVPTTKQKSATLQCLFQPEHALLHHKNRCPYRRCDSRLSLGLVQDGVTMQKKSHGNDIF